MAIENSNSEMTDKFVVQDLGQCSYSDALVIQEQFFNEKIKGKSAGLSNKLSNRLLLVEHDPVYTLGKSGDIKNLKIDPDSVGATFYKTTRGGDITYHGPGQIVAYPIFDLEQFEIGLAKYIWNLEEVIIRVIANFNLEGSRIKEASGVWLDSDKKSARKICAIGVKASRFVTMHGLAFNVNTELAYFDHIIPCGIDDKAVTSIANEVGESVDFEEVKNMLIREFETVFT